MQDSDKIKIETKEEELLDSESIEKEKMGESTQVDESRFNQELKNKFLKNKKAKINFFYRKRFLIVLSLLLMVLGIGLYIMYTEANKNKKNEVENNELGYQYSGRGSYVYVPRTGRRYHRRPNCGRGKNMRRVTLARAKKMGYTPCRKCY